MRRLRDLITGIVSLALVALLLFGVPAALLVIVGFPLPTEAPELDTIIRHVEDGNIPDVFVVKALAVIIWLVWAQLAVALLTETVAIVRGRAARRAPVVPVVQAMAGKLVASTVLIASALAPGRTLGAAPIEPIQSEVSALVIEQSAAAGAPGPGYLGPGQHGDVARNGPIGDAPIIDGGAEGAGASRRAARADGRYRTTDTDNWWDLAERLLGDGMRWSELRDLNSGRTMLTGDLIDERTDDVRAGWDLDVPPDADPALLVRGERDPIPADRDPAASAPASAQPSLASAQPSPASTAPPQPSAAPTKPLRPLDGEHVSSPLVEAIKPYTLVYEGPSGAVDDGPGVPYQVVEGDNLWDIAARHLGDPFRWPEIYESSRDLDQTFGRRITDPNLIWPDSILWLPTDATAVPPADPALVREVVGPVSGATGPANQAPPARSEDAPLTPVTAEDLRRAAEAAGRAAERGAAAGPPDRGPGGGLEPGDRTDSAASEDRAAEADGAGTLADRVGGAPAAAFGAGGVLVATGLLGMLERTRRLRRSQAGEAARPAPPPLELIDIETVLRATADGSRARAVRRAIDSLADRTIVAGEPMAAPEVIRVAGDRMEVVQRGQDPDLPAGWADGGVATVPGRSVARLTGDQLTEPDANGAANSAANGAADGDGNADLGADLATTTPTCVTVGGGLLLNLEVAGIVAIDGPPVVAAGLVRSMVQELATGPARRAIDIRLSTWVPGADLHDRVVSEPLDRIATTLEPWLEDVELAVTAAGAFSAHALRASAGPDALPAPTVLFADAADADHLRPVLTAAGRHTMPLAVVLTGDVQAAGIEPGVTIVVDEETLRLEPYGFTAATQHLDADVILGVQSLIDQAARAPMVVRSDEEQATILPADIDTDPAQVPTEETPEHDIVTELPADQLEVTDQATDGDAGIMIRVLGPLELENGPEDLGPQERFDQAVAVLAFLALVGPSTPEQIIDAVWPGGGMDPERFDRFLADLRSTLGPRLLDAGDGRYRVRSVNTDLGSARRWLSQASALSAERARNLVQLALSDVRGRPFAAVPARYWQWVADHKMAIETQATSMLVDACFELCDSAYGANDVYLAQWACDVGSLVDPLNETLVTRRVQLLQLQDEHDRAIEAVQRWEAAYADAAGRPAPNGPRSALEPVEVMAPHVG